MEEKILLVLKQFNDGISFDQTGLNDCDMRTTLEVIAQLEIWKHDTINFLLKNKEVENENTDS